MSGFYEPPPAFSSPFRDRLMTPHWGLIASHLGRPVPAVLRALYEHPERLLRSHCQVLPPGGEPPRWLDLFLPMDEAAVAPDGVALPGGAVAFADDEHGDPYVFVPEPPPAEDGPVYVRQQQGGGRTLVPVAPTLSAFLGWERRLGH